MDRFAALNKLLTDLPEFRVGALLEGAEEKWLAHREVLFRAGEEAAAFVIVLEGALKLVKSSATGDDVVVFIATPGDPVGGLIMMQARSVYPVTVIAMGQSKVMKIPRSTFEKAWSSDAAILQKISGAFVARVGDLQDQKVFVKAPLPVKIARLLLSLIERFDSLEPGVLPVPLTRQEIADSTGASVESVIRVMSDWSKRGILKTSDQHIEVQRIDTLAEILKGAKE